MAMTLTGLQTSRYTEIVDRVKQSLLTNLSPNIDLSEDSAIGILISTICLELSDVHEITSEVYDSWLVTKAEGYALDEICLQNAVYRILATSTTGQLEVTGDNGATVLSTTPIRSTTGDIFYPREDKTLSPTSCIEATMTVNSVKPNIKYTVIIDNDVYEYTSKTTGETADGILNGLAAKINGGLIAKASVTNSTSTEPGTLKVYKDPNDINSRPQLMSINSTSYLTYTIITTIVYIDAAETGEVLGASGTVNQLDTTVAGIYGVNNRYDLTLGRAQETDTELRQRYLDSITVTGTATSDAILNAVRRVAEVITAQIEENDMDTTQNGIPPKSFKVTVVGGDNDNIAQAIWNTKPVGIHSFGTELGHAKDINSGIHEINFARPTPNYVYLKATWEVFDEEQLNFLQGEVEDQIKVAINEYGKTMAIGADIIPNRLFGYIYNRVKGIIVDDLQMAIKPDQNTPPSASDWKTDRISIPSTGYTRWDSSRYTLTEKP